MRTLAINAYYTSDDIKNYQLGNNDDEFSRVLKTDLNGIFGIPYQFMNTVDTRIDGTDLGAKYAEKIVSRMPLLFITPCKQKFMEGFNAEDKETVLNALLSGSGLGELGNSLSAVGKYYTTTFAYDEYMEQVNHMCAQVASFLGIADIEVPFNGSKTKIREIDWTNAKNGSFKNYIHASKASVYYVDGLDSMSESFGNSTTESGLASTINGYSDQANEIKFLLGENSALSSLMQAGQSLTDTIGNTLSGTITDFAGGMLGDLASTGVSTILTGGKILFPKIWQDSSFDRSYNFSIKLRSPDHDSVSIFFNILVPYLHLLGHVLAVGMDTDFNGYCTPFLCKAYCKGMFNIDMGLITSMTVNRGATAQWNNDGLPTQIDIEITIEDLYSNLFMTNSAYYKKKAGIFNPMSSVFSAYSVATNTAMMDFLANLAGLNIADTEFGRRIEMFKVIATQDFTNLPGRVWNKFDNKINSFIASMYNRL